MPRSPESGLADLLVSSFSPGEIRSFLFRLPDGPAILESIPMEALPPRDLCDQVVLCLRRRGNLDEGLFTALLQERPARARELAELAASLGLSFHPPEITPLPVRGPIPSPRARYDSSWHVEVPEVEAKALGYLESPGSPVVLWGPWLSGKTWMMDRLLSSVQNPGSQDVVVELDLPFLLQNTTPEMDFWRVLGEEVARSLDEESDSLDKEWRRPSSPVMHLTRWMEDIPLRRAARSGGRLVLALDDADGAMDSPVRNEFFGMLRAWAQRAGRNWELLRLVLAISTTPTRLVTAIHQSPFSLSDKIPLGVWDERASSRLGQLYGFPADEVLPLLQPLGRHPYLLRAALFHARSLKVQPREVLDPRSGAFDTFFQEYRKRLHLMPPDIRDALHQLTRAGVRSLPRDLSERLRDIGLAHLEGDGLCRLRADLFARLLD